MKLQHGQACHPSRKGRHFPSQQCAPTWKACGGVLLRTVRMRMQLAESSPNIQSGSAPPEGRAQMQRAAATNTRLAASTKAALLSHNAANNSSAVFNTH